MVNLTNEKFIRGKVIYRAERDYPTGVIKIDNLFHAQSNRQVKEFLDSPSRAVLYNFETSKPLDLFQNVYFQIVEFNGVQLAIEIKDSLSHLDSELSRRDKFVLLNNIHLNLHNGDKHREGPKHLRIHIVGYSEVNANPSLTKIEVIDDETDETSFRYIRTADLPDEDDMNNIYYIQFDMTIDTFQVYSLDLNHIH